MNCIAVLTTLALIAAPPLVNMSRAGEVLSFSQGDGSLSILADGKPFATYVWSDPQISRPYLAHVRASNGMQVTRTLPPVEGQDPIDHATMHPGIWLAFGDISGADFWRNKGAVKHVAFVQSPQATGAVGSFAVRNWYLQGERVLCEELCRIRIELKANSRVIDWESQFSSNDDDFYFGDQEEMGLGVRVASGIAVKIGGMPRNSDGLANEKQIWGKQAAWCDYSGTVDGQEIGVLLIPDPKNFRPSWFHARDYGLVVANPFGKLAFTKSEASKVLVKKGESLGLRFGIIVHSGPFDLSAAYTNWMAAAKQ